MTLMAKYTKEGVHILFKKDAAIFEEEKREEAKKNQKYDYIIHAS